ncbi:MAG: hypothetical protein LC624_06325 [Halobacteriales archaeon]|nr:hypothetical protein [Halobacteriales archaeon]
MRLLALLALAALAGCTVPAVPLSGQVVTLADVVAGTFVGGRDKLGTGGVAVLVHNVTVHVVRNEEDGDWHLGAGDATKDPFIMEIVPRDQGNLSKPPVGPRLAVLGVPFCDRAHQAEDWHGFTCWELHPVLAWQREP